MCGRCTPAARQDAMVSPAQSYEPGPSAANTYGLPTCAMANLTAVRALADGAPVIVKFGAGSLPCLLLCDDAGLVTCWAAARASAARACWARSYAARCCAVRVASRFLYVAICFSTATFCLPSTARSDLAR